MVLKLNTQAGQPLYLQLIQQIRHAVDTGVLQTGDQLPGIRTLAEELVVSHNTVAKAYSELEHGGVIELRHGSGAFIRAGSRRRSPLDKVLAAQERIHDLVEELRTDNLSDDEIRRMFEAELLYAKQPANRK